MIARLAAVNALLRSELDGANIDAMVSEDPQLLTQDPASISKGKPARSILLKHIEYLTMRPLGPITHC